MVIEIFHDLNWMKLYEFHQGEIHDKVYNIAFECTHISCERN